MLNMRMLALAGSASALAAGLPTIVLLRLSKRAAALLMVVTAPAASTDTFAGSDDLHVKVIPEMGEPPASRAVASNDCVSPRAASVTVPGATST